MKKRSILSFFFVIISCSGYSQLKDTYIDSLFQVNMDYLYSKVKHGIDYDPLLDNRRDLYEFLVIFQLISGESLIGIGYQPPKTDLKSIIKLNDWFNIYGCCINKYDYIEAKRVLFDIESLHYISLDDYFDKQNKTFGIIERKIKEYDRRVNK